jgi:type VI protein secretion system component Hcp
MKRSSLVSALVAAVAIAMSGSAHAAAARPGPAVGQLVLEDGAAAPVHGYSWSVSAGSSWIKGAGPSVAKPVPEAIHITRQVDASSVKALLRIATGQVFESAVLTVNVGRGKDTSTMVYEMEGLFVTNVTHGAEEGLVTESISFVFKAVKWTLTDSAGNVTSGRWDIPSGTTS